MYLRRALIIFLGIMICLNASSVVSAGQLDDFEKAATKRSTSSEKKEHERNDHVHHDDDHSSWGEFFGAFLGEIVAVVFIESFKGMFSSARHEGQSGSSSVQGPSEPEHKDAEPRSEGSPRLPFIRTDLNYHRVHSGIEGLDGRVEVGYGPFGLQYRTTRFEEDSSEDDMTLSYVHGLYRFSVKSAFEFDIGLGAVTLEGEDRNSGPSVTFPININPHPNVNIRLVPTWSDIHDNGIGDYDGSIAYVYKSFSLRLGYERVQTHDEVLQGPYAGISLQY